MQPLIGIKTIYKNLKREVTTEDIIRLTELPFMRISRYDRDKAEENILALEGKMEQVKHHLANLVTYALIILSIFKKYGKDKERKTELRILIR